MSPSQTSWPCSLPYLASHTELQGWLGSLWHPQHSASVSWPTCPSPTPARLPSPALEATQPHRLAATTSPWPLSPDWPPGHTPLPVSFEMPVSADCGSWYLWLVKTTSGKIFSYEFLNVNLESQVLGIGEQFMEPQGISPSSVRECTSDTQIDTETSSS